MKIFSLSLLSVLLTSLVPAAFAGDEFEYLGNDLDSFDRVLEEIDADQETFETEMDFQSTTRVFPASDDGQEDDGSGSMAGVVPSTTHAYVYIDDIAVIFADVPLDQWFAPFVLDMADRGIISGYKDASGTPLGAYGPADNVTLEQLAKIAVEAAKIDVSTCPATAKNPAASGRWSEGYIACAESLLWSVYAEGSIDVQGLASRRDVVLTVLQAFGKELEPSAKETFTDVPKTMAYRDAIEMAAIDGIVEGYKDADGKATGIFGPFDPVKRAEIAKIVSLSIKAYGVQ